MKLGKAQFRDEFLKEIRLCEEGNIFVFTTKTKILPNEAIHDGHLSSLLATTL